MADEAAEPDVSETRTAGPMYGSGKFYFPNDATYEGEWKLIPDSTAGDDTGAEEGAADAGEGDKSGAADATGQDGEDGSGAETDADVEKDEEPKGTYLRHGKGKYIEGDYIYDGEWVDVRTNDAPNISFCRVNNTV